MERVDIDMPVGGFHHDMCITERLGMTSAEGSPNGLEELEKDRRDLQVFVHVFVKKIAGEVVHMITYPKHHH